MANPLAAELELVEKQEYCRLGHLIRILIEINILGNNESYYTNFNITMKDRSVYSTPTPHLQPLIVVRRQHAGPREEFELGGGDVVASVSGLEAGLALLKSGTIIVAVCPAPTPDP